jgi:hypothetical protein
MMKNYKNTYQNTLIASGKQNFQGEVIEISTPLVVELEKQLLENIRVGQQELKRKGKICYHLEM